MIYAYFQDGHKQGKNSAMRIGNYSEDWLLKFDELLAIAKKYKAEAILDNGDLLDSPEPSYRVIDEIADRVESAKIPVYSLFGNHAERYHSMEHSKYTGLAHLQKRSPYFKYLNNITGKDFIIQGIEYSHDVEERIKEKGIFLQAVAPKAWRVAIVHAFVSPKVFPYATHVVCDDIKTNADLILVGHYHSVWQKKVGDTQYVDIGCFGRLGITEKDIQPSCIILDTDKRSWEIIPLKSAKPGDEVFDVKRMAELKANIADIDAFIKSLESTTYQAASIKDIILQLAKENNVDKEITNLIIQRLETIDVRV